MTETENFKMKKPAQDDFYNVDDFNENADKTDDALTSVGAITDGAYGVEVDFESGEIKRIGAAKGLLPGADFDNITPWHRQRCIVGHDGTVYAYQGDADYTETGFYTPPTKGQDPGTVAIPVSVCVEQLPFYYRIVTLDASETSPYALKKARFYISATPRYGFILPSCFKADSAGTVSPIYLSAYETCRYDARNKAYETLVDTTAIDTTSNVLASVADGATLKSDRNFADSTDPFTAFKSMLPGTGWKVVDEEIYALTQLLFLIENAGFDGQTGDYRGQTDLWGRTPCDTGYTFSGSSGLKNGYIASFASNSIPLFVPADTTLDSFLAATHACFADSGGSHYLHGGSSADGTAGLFSVERSDTPYTVRFCYNGISKSTPEDEIARLTEEIKSLKNTVNQMLEGEAK